MTWTGAGKTTFTGDRYTVAYHDGIWVADGRTTNSLAHPTNGVNWTGIGTADVSEVYTVKNIDGVWYAGGNNGLKRSADGITWFYKGIVEGANI